MTTFEEELERNGRLIYTNMGVSMLPLIHQHRDLLIIDRPEGRLKKYDIPLYKRKNGQYVLHRILKVTDTGYVLCGDNQWKKEYGVTDDQILGVLTGLVRDGREISMDGIRYRLYVHLWCDLFFLRTGYLFTRRLLRKVIRRLRP